MLQLTTEVSRGRPGIQLLDDQVTNYSFLTMLAMFDLNEKQNILSEYRRSQGGPRDHAPQIFGASSHFVL